MHGTALVYPGDELPEPLRSFIETARGYENSERFSQSSTPVYTGIRPFYSARRSVYSKAVKVMLVNLEGTVRVPHRTDSIAPRLPGNRKKGRVITGNYLGITLPGITG